jgi:putative transposase
MTVSHDILREWSITFSPLVAEERRHREPRPCARWCISEVCTSVGGVRPWLWRAVDDHPVVLDVFVQRDRDTEAARTSLAQLLRQCDVAETMGTDKLASDGTAIGAIPALEKVDHQQVVSTARCNPLIEQSHQANKSVANSASEKSSGPRKA